MNRKALRLLVVVALLVIALQGARSAVAAPPPPFLHGLFTDHVVLQRNARFPVWGQASPGTRVTVRFRGQSQDATASSDGRWQVELGPFSAGGPFTMEVDGPQRVVLQDVLVGDVWICSGQSNMEQGVLMARDPQREVAAAEHPTLRLFTVPKAHATTPQPDVQGRWVSCTPAAIAKSGTWGGFSAVAYFFGRDLQRDLKVPIGLIQTSWGGTPAEAWVAARDLRGKPQLKVANEMLDLLVAADPDALHRKRMESWWQKNDPGSSTMPGWASPSLDQSAWKVMRLPGIWEEAGLPDFDGVVWFRRVVDVPADWAGRDLVVSLGPIDDVDTTFFNGVAIGGLGEWDAKRQYPVPGRLVRSGPNVVAVRVLDVGGAGGLWGKPHELALRRADGAGGVISLAGDWMYRPSVTLAQVQPVASRAGGPYTASVLYNAMVAPLLPFAVKGVIWYQGESNASRYRDYRTVMETLVGCWRAGFCNPGMPFLVVQLANFGPLRAEPAPSGWAGLREAQQQLAQRVPGVGLVTAVDIGESADIHPKNKQDVGARLALAARGLVYGENVSWRCPAFRAMRVEGDRVAVTFDSTGGGLEARGGKVHGFAVAGADHRFAWADAVIDGDSVVLSSPAVAQPVAVRYAWADSPDCSLYGRQGLPVLPFRTDRWDD